MSRDRDVLPDDLNPDGLPRGQGRRLRLQTRQVLEACAGDRTQRDGDDPVAVIARAVVATSEHLGLSAHPNQILAALTLHDGVVIEMATGEGKTLSAAYAACAWARQGKRVHIVTANDYLAERDARWMAPIYDSLGVTVAHVRGAGDPDAAEKYTADVIYATLDTFAVDYLRDHSGAAGITPLRQAPAQCLLIDEADAVLIDAARSSITLSRRAPMPARDWEKFSTLARQITEEYLVIDAAGSLVTLTEDGYDRAAQLLEVDLDSLTRDTEMVHHLDAALAAQHLYLDGRDYLVVDGAIVLIDPVTGRSMTGGRLRGSVHPAVETKEGLTLTSVSQVASTISVRAFVSRYEVIAGMTGTFGHDDVEITDTYGVPTARIPRHHPSKRQDHPDALFVTQAQKFSALTADISARHASGQPVLVAAPSVAEAEAISARLLAVGIDHELLTARDARNEADVLAQAGRAGQVTVTTTMAGRGVDIALGGDPVRLAARALGLDSDQARDLLLQGGDGAQPLHHELQKWRAACTSGRAKAIEAGGLAIVATSRHSSQRADAQLRGRCGRQGEPGETRFYLSLEDDLVVRFAPPKTTGLLGRLLSRADELGGAGRKQSEARIAKMVDAAQQRYDQALAGARARVLRYDFVISAQREAVFAWREEAMSAPIADLIGAAIPESVRYPEFDESEDRWVEADVVDIVAQAWRGVVERSPDVDEEMRDEVVRRLLLSVIDECWAQQVEDLDALRDVVALRSTGVKSAYALMHEYTKAAGEAFAEMREDVSEKFYDRLTRLSIRTAGVQKPAAA